MMGVQIGENVVFAGKVNTKFNGDPTKIIIGNNVIFSGDIDLRNRENGCIVIEDNCSFDDGLRFVAARESTIRIGEGTGTGMMFVINAGGNVTIGRMCMVSSYVHINGSGHPTFRDSLMMEQGYIQGTVSIGEDVWLANCTNVLMNSVIEKGVIVSANSVVSGFIPEYSIILGNPAKIIGQRVFKDESKNKVVVEKIQNHQLSSMNKEEMKDILNNLFRSVFSIEAPEATAMLKGEGVLDSLNWLSWIEAVEKEFRISLPIQLTQSKELESIEGLISFLNHDSYDVEECEPLELPEIEYHLCNQLDKMIKQTPEKKILTILIDNIEYNYSYTELSKRIDECISVLKINGLEKLQRLAIIRPTSLDLMASFFAAIKIGAIPSVHSFPSLKISVEQYVNSHRKIFETMSPDMVFCSEELAKEISIILDPATKVIHEIIASSENTTYSVSNEKTEATAFIQHSSGTTGVQKGIALSHKSVSLQLIHYSKFLKLNSKDKIFSWLPLYHDMGLITGFLLPLLHGVPLYLMSPFDWINAPTKLFETMQKNKSTLCWMPNFAFNIMTRRIGEKELEVLDLSSVRKFISCSEPVSEFTMNSFYEKFSDKGLVKNALTSCYAMAENTFAVTQSDSYKSIAINSEQMQKNKKVVLDNSGQKFVSQGKTIDNNLIKIYDDDSKTWLNEGRIGLVYVSSDSMLNEYYKKPEASKELFNDGFYNTGDIGFLWKQELYLTGRKKDLIIIGGRNFYPHDIEEIIHSFEEIKDGRCVAFGVEDPLNGTEKIVALAERSDDKKEVAPDLIANIKEAVFLELDCVLSNLYLKNAGEIIKTSSGKISRSACREWFLKQ